MDIGAGYELSANKFWATMTIAGSLFLTALLWFYVLVVRS
jgi:succinate dehydrogenase / fumarate reductase, cytochrome b subunit